MKKNITPLQLPMLMLITAQMLVFPFNHPKIPLEKAIADGLKLSYDYQNLYLDQTGAEIKRLQAAKNKLFNLNFSANYLFKSDTMIIETPKVHIPGSITLPGHQIEAGLKNNYDFKLSLLQPLFTGGLLSYSEKMSEIKKAIAASRTELKGHEITGLIKTSYFHYMLLTRKQKSLTALQNKLALHHGKLKNLFSEGLVKKSDLLETLSQLEELNLTLNDTEMAIENERNRFHLLCGLYPENIDEHYREKTLSSLAAWEFFKSQHPVLKQLDSQREILMVKKKTVSSRYLPQVSGFAEIHYGRPGIDFFKKEWALYFQGGITLQLPLFDWSKGKSERELIDLEIMKLDNQKKNLIRDIELQINHLYAAIKTLESKLIHMEQLIKYAQEDGQLKASLYQERQIPHTDYLAALLNLEKYSFSKEEIIFQIEKIKVNINILIGNAKEKS